MSALIATQWFGAVCACSGIPRACRSYRTAKHIWLGLLHFHYGPILSLALVERGAPGKCLHLPPAGFTVGVLPSPGASVSVSAMHGTESRAELGSGPDVAGGGCQAVEKQLSSCADTA